MSEFSYLADRTAAHQIRERVDRAQRSAMPARRPRRPARAGRHTLASTLHRIADRLDV